MDVRASATAATLVAVLTACGSGADDSPGSEEPADQTRPEAAPSASTQASTASTQGGTASPGPAPTTGGGDRSAAPASGQDSGREPQPEVRVFDEAGVTVIMPDEVADESAAAALDVYTDYLVEWRRSLRVVQLSDRLRGLAAQPRIDRLQGSLDYQRRHGIRYGGEVTVEPYVEGASENVVTIGFCIDAAELVVIDDDGERPADGVEQSPRTTGRAELNRTETGWQVTDEVFSAEETC
ncbi:hypothetical protein [Phytoactinopolyspora halotolerans]|uniref:Lipoprotein n=1 Tax=Phytoactinopolyspora halotolerans TaxID=1981512 RepID=A0A6L9SCJ4_9ACTN|nr:hypothetical protein [Phytoactinopolyspora halotolerans]NEE02793.1 hypothetical protein [Phytoactinopolyspora halotolerans]